MTTEMRPKKGMTGGVRRPRGPHGHWSYYLDLGPQPAQRCQACDGRFWVDHRNLETCPDCGGELLATMERRTQTQGGFATRTAAVKARATAVHELGRGQHVTRDDISFAEYLTDMWLPTLRGSNLRHATVVSYEQHVRHHLADSALGPVPLQKLTREQLMAFYGKLREQGRRRGDKPLAPATVRRIHATVHRALRDAVRARLLIANPAADMELPSGASRERGAWGSEQVQKFLSGVRDDRLGSLWLLAATTGARRGELLGLRWQDVELPWDDEKIETGEVTGRLRIRHTLLRVAGETVESEPKTEAGKRTISLDPPSIRALVRQRALQEVERALAGDDWVDSTYVFTTVLGEALQPDLVTRLFRAAVLRSGLPYIPLHGLRHSFTTVALNERGQPIGQVSARLGHADVKVTLAVYQHALRERDEALACDVASAVVPEGF